jgi:hypothetical protein
MSSNIPIAQSTTDTAKAIYNVDSDDQSDIAGAKGSDFDDSPWEVSSESDEELDLHTNRQQHQQHPAQTIRSPYALVSEIDRGQNPITVSLESVQFIISCLWKLPIRRPAPLDRIKEAPVSETSPYDLFDLMHVKTKFPAIDERLATRLGKMMSRRRQVIMRYRKLHTDELQGNHSRTGRHVVAAINDEDDESSALVHRLAASTRYTHDTNTATLNLDISTRTSSDQRTQHASLTASFGSSAGSNRSDDSMRIVIPKRPEGNFGDAPKQFICPYCQVAQSIRTDRKWR